METTSLQNRDSNILEILNIVNPNLDQEDRIYLNGGISWEKYNLILKQLTDYFHYRISYLESTLQIMSPGRNHEKIKEYISGLLEAYFQEAEIDYYPLGSTTFKSQNNQAGKEPDSCYCIETEKKFPDLAIEVIFSSGGLDVLEIYKALEIKEVWLWKKGELKIYCLAQGYYTENKNSKLLPNLDIELFKTYLSQPNLRLAIKEFKKQINN